MKYYPINEDLAHKAKEMNSFFDYVPGSATLAYRRSVDEAVQIAEFQKQRVDPIHHEKIDRLVDAHARRLAENINQNRPGRPVLLCVMRASDGPPAWGHGSGSLTTTLSGRLTN